MEENDSLLIDGRRVVLIRIPKNASRSMAKALGLHLPGVHKPRSILEREIVDESLLFVAAIRNPLERLVSWHAYHAPMDSDTYFGGGIYGFREWVSRGCPHRFVPCCNHAHPFEQCRWIKGEKGEIKLLSYARLQEEWNQLFKSAFPLPWINSSQHAEWMDYYDDKTKRVAECVVWNDLNAFGF